MNRRTFLVAGTIGVAAVSLPAYYYLGPVDLDPAMVRPSDLDLIWDKDEVLEAGRKYRNAYPDEDSHRTLTRLLNGKVPETQVKDDFAAGSTVMIDGWLLSVTESRQCALLSLAASNA